MNGFKILFFVLLVAAAIGYAYSQGWLGEPEEVEHCYLNTEGIHRCE